MDVDTEHKQLWLADEQSWQIISLDSLRLLLCKNAVVFVDLEVHGLYLIQLFRQLGFEEFTVTAYNLKIYAIYFSKVVFKDCVALGLTVERGQTAKSWTYLNLLNTFLTKRLQLTLYSYKTTSLAAIAMELVTRSKTNCFLECEAGVEGFVRRAYFGGRCELYLPGKFRDVLYYDFPSMYGTLLLEPFPTQLGHLRTTHNMDEISAGFVEATVEQPASLPLPILPYRGRYGVYFPTGVFRGVFWKEELDFFINEGGRLISVHAVIEATNSKASLGPIATELINLRQAGYEFAKPLLNSIYGRLAMRAAEYRTSICDEATALAFLAKHPQARYRAYEGICLVENKLITKTPQNRNIAIGTIIPARARIKLLRLAFACIRAGAAVIYVDTDAIFCKPPKDAALLQKLASFAFIEEGIFYCEKNYSYHLTNTEVVRGSKKNFFKSFKRKNIGNRTEPHQIDYPPHS